MLVSKQNHQNFCLDDTRATANFLTGIVLWPLSPISDQETSITVMIVVVVMWQSPNERE